MSTRTPGLTWLNGADEGEAHAALREVCASTAWAERLLGRRPYADADALLAESDAATAELTPEDLAEAMAGHPPIGRPRPDDPDSAREQRGMAGASEELRARMLELNLAYQERFGHVFLICATGLTGEEMRDALTARLGNTPERERENVRGELVKINRVRLTRLAHGGARKGMGGAHAPGPASVSTHILDTSAGRPAAGVAVRLSARTGADGDGAWEERGGSLTDADGRCKDLPELPQGTTRVRLCFETGPYLHRKADPRAEEQDVPPARDGGGFFPEVTVTFTVTPGEHYHVPLLLNPFGYSVYRGS